MNKNQERQIALDGIRAAMIEAGHTCWQTDWVISRDGKLFLCQANRDDEEITPQQFGEFIANTI